MDAEDITRRLPKMMQVFGPGSDPLEPVIACINVDRSKLPTGPGVPAIPKPSILHSIVKCDICAEDCWIGPKQASAKGTRTCYICLGILYHYNAFPMATVSLNPDIDSVPRRAD